MLRQIAFMAEIAFIGQILKRICLRIRPKTILGQILKGFRLRIWPKHILGQILKGICLGIQPKSTFEAKSYRRENISRPNSEGNFAFRIWRENISGPNPNGNLP